MNKNTQFLKDDIDDKSFIDVVVIVFVVIVIVFVVIDVILGFIVDLSSSASLS